MNHTDATGSHDADRAFRALNRTLLKKSVMMTLLIWISLMSLYDCFLLIVPSFDVHLDEKNPTMYWLIVNLGLWPAIVIKLIGTLFVVVLIPRLKHRWPVVLTIAGFQTLLLWYLTYG